MASGKHSLPRTLSTFVIVMLAMLMAVPSRADDVTFFDTTDTVTAGTIGSRVTIPDCGFTTTAFFGGLTLEACEAIVSAPSGFFFNSSGSFGPQLLIAEAGGLVSDVILLNEISATSVKITFLSDPSTEGIPVPCGTVVGGCQMFEDGTVQPTGGILWADIAGDFTADGVNFDSDVVEAPVPEPASLVLLGGGFLAIAGYIRRLA